MLPAIAQIDGGLCWSRLWWPHEDGAFFTSDRITYHRHRTGPSVFSQASSYRDMLHHVLANGDSRPLNWNSITGCSVLEAELWTRSGTEAEPIPRLQFRSGYRIVQSSQLQPPQISICVFPALISFLILFQRTYKNSFLIAAAATASSKHD